MSRVYDVLGRPKTRQENDLTSSWAYDTGPMGLGKLVSAGTASGDAAGYPGGFTRSYGYDGTTGRLSTTILQFGTDQSVTFTDTYVPLGQGGAGRLASVTDGAGNSVESFAYTAQGNFTQLIRGTVGYDASAVYTIATADASMRPLRTTLGTAAFSNSLPLPTQANPAPVVTDQYYYDQLAQLREADVTVPTPSGVTTVAMKTVGYDKATGNIQSKNEVGVTVVNAGLNPHFSGGMSVGVRNCPSVADCPGSP